MLYFSKIRGIREVDNTTELLVEIDGKVSQKILKYKQNNSNIDAEILIDDKRRITTPQRKKIYATINDIANFTGNLPDDLKEYFKYDFMAKTGMDYFSLSNRVNNSASIDTAREFINYLIEFVLIHDIPLMDLAVLRTDDIDKYLYYCLKYKKCCITGKKAEIHHCTGSRVGMGRNRKTIDHSELELIALSREWHTKVHNEGENEIFEKYKIYGIKIDRQTLKLLGLNYEDIS